VVTARSSNSTADCEVTRPTLPAAKLPIFLPSHFTVVPDFATVTAMVCHFCRVLRTAEVGPPDELVGTRRAVVAAPPHVVLAGQVDDGGALPGTRGGLTDHHAGVQRIGQAPHLHRDGVGGRHRGAELADEVVARLVGLLVVPPLIFQVPVRGVHAPASPLKSAVSAPPAAFPVFAVFAALLAEAPAASEAVAAGAVVAGDPVVGAPLDSPTQAPPTSAASKTSNPVPTHGPRTQNPRRRRTGSAFPSATPAGFSPGSSGFISPWVDPVRPAPFVVDGTSCC